MIKILENLFLSIFHMIIKIVQYSKKSSTLSMITKNFSEPFGLKTYSSLQAGSKGVLKF